MNKFAFQSTKIVALSLLALALAACGGSNQETLVDETVTLAEGESATYNFRDQSLYGTEYDFEVSTNNNGVSIELSRIDLCDNTTAPIKSYYKTCRITKDGILKVINPIGPGAGGSEAVRIRVKRDY
jgi:hypothetical protein